VLPQLNQGLTFDCGPFSCLTWLLAYSYDPRPHAVWSNAIALADRQQGLAWGQQVAIVDSFILATGARGYNGCRYIYTFKQLDQALRAGRCVILGLYLGDLHPGWPYQHYECIQGTCLDDFQLKDTLAAYDGENGRPSRSQLEQALRDGWDASIVGIEFDLEKRGP
jgi:hypothetical protein